MAALVAVLAISLLLAVRVMMPRKAPSRARSARPASAQVVAEAAPAPAALAQSAAQEDGGKSANEAPSDGGGDEGADGLVEDFYEETDKWAATGGGAARPTVEDASAFAAKFAALPGGRKEECLQRALNLVPDENVMVLVGILMDKTQEKEFVQLVFNDILNRPDGVKKPILEQVLADKEHPCIDDATWIFEVTGEK